MSSENIDDLVNKIIADNNSVEFLKDLEALFSSLVHFELENFLRFYYVGYHFTPKQYQEEYRFKQLKKYRKRLLKLCRSSEILDTVDGYLRERHNLNKELVEKNKIMDFISWIAILFHEEYSTFDYRKALNGNYDWVDKRFQVLPLFQEAMEAFMILEFFSLENELHASGQEIVSLPLKAPKIITSYKWQGAQEDLKDLYQDLQHFISEETTFEEFKGVFSALPVTEISPIKWRSGTVGEIIFLIMALTEHDLIEESKKRFLYSKLIRCFVKTDGSKFENNFKQIKYAILLNISQRTQEEITKIVKNQL